MSKLKIKSTSCPDEKTGSPIAEGVKKPLNDEVLEVVNRLKEQKYDVEFEPDVKEMIAKEGIDKNFGARPLRRTIQNLVEDKLAEKILDGKLVKGKVNKITKKQL